MLRDKELPCITEIKNIPINNKRLSIWNQLEICDDKLVHMLKADSSDLI